MKTKTHKQVFEEWGVDNVNFSLGESGPTWDLDSLPNEYYEYDLDEHDKPRAFWTEEGEAFMKSAEGFLKSQHIVSRSTAGFAQQTV